MALVEARDVAFAYDAAGRRNVVVRDVNFDIDAGETLAILGPSGCGKTTLLMGAAGFNPPSSGVIRLAGKAIGAPSPDRMVVFQDFNQLFAWRTVRSNLTYAARAARGVSDAEAGRRADAMLELVGVGFAAAKYPHELSGGMKQRVALARALVVEPQMLLLDEPFAALDELTRAKLQRELREICRATRMTAMLVTHSLHEAVFLGDRVLVMGGAPASVAALVDTRAVTHLHDVDQQPAVAAIRAALDVVAVPAA